MQNTEPKKNKFVLLIVIFALIISALLIFLVVYLLVIKPSLDSRSKAAVGKVVTLSMTTPKTTNVTGTFDVNFVMNTDVATINVVQMDVTFNQSALDLVSLTYVNDTPAWTQTGLGTTNAKLSTVTNGKFTISIFSTEPVKGPNIPLLKATFKVKNDNVTSTAEFHYVIPTSAAGTPADDYGTFASDEGGGQNAYKSEIPLSITTGNGAAATNTPAVTTAVVTTAPVSTTTVSPTRTTESTAPVVTNTITASTGPLSTTDVAMTTSVASTTSVVQTTAAGYTSYPTSTSTYNTTSPTSTTIIYNNPTSTPIPGSGGLPNTGVFENTLITLAVGIGLFGTGLVFYKFNIGRKRMN